ncbi:MAG: Nramp family divalent metal transporter [Phycisphaerae bacterium]
MTETKSKSPTTIFAMLAPGILVAATGVGAGDLVSAGMAGAKVGLTILWAALAGTALKWFLTEGIARWQLATKTSLLEGWTRYLGQWFQWLFLIYLFAWSIFTGGAIIKACASAGHSLLPLASSPENSSLAWGIIHAFVAYVLVRFGGYSFFEKAMSICIAMMFLTVITTAVLLKPEWSEILKGLLIPKLPGGEANTRVLSVLGGVGGTVTMLSYGYWIREEHRTGNEGWRICRIDLAVGYAVTAIFAIAMMVIGQSAGAEITADKKAFAGQLAGQLAVTLGETGRWIFLFGFWGAVFSSLLGVWQGIPYLFADFMGMRRRDPAREVEATNLDDANLTETRAYRWYLIAMAVMPLPLLRLSVDQAQLIYTLFGSLFIPMLALTLLYLNNRREVPPSFRNGWGTNLVLGITAIFFLYMAAITAINKIGKLMSMLTEA